MGTVYKETFTKPLPAVPFDPGQWRQTQRDQKAAGLPADAPLFTVPAGLIRILDRDLKAAGIPKTDERGRTIDVHALRHTFGTYLSKGGVSPRTAQAAMRHSDIDLTMNVYTDPHLLDVAGAMNALPTLPLPGGTEKEGIAVKATGTDDLPPSPLVPTLVPTSAKRNPMWSTQDKRTSKPGEKQGGKATARNVFADKHLRPLSALDNGRFEERQKGVEPSTLGLGSRGWRRQVCS